MNAQSEIREFGLGQLNGAEYNPRIISDQAFAGLSASLKRFGCVEPIVVNVRDGRNRIVSGHMRHSALIEGLGPKGKVLCVTVDLSDADEKLLNLTLNNPEIQGDFVECLAGYIDSLRGEISGQDAVDLRINDLQKSITGVDVTEIDFNPEDDGTRLDELNSQAVKCPHCGEEFDVRKSKATDSTV